MPWAKAGGYYWLIGLLWAGTAWAEQTSPEQPLPKEEQCQSEACLKSRAQQNLGIDFPAYLTWRYCGRLRQLFVNDGQRRLAGYQSRFSESHSPQHLQRALSFVQQQQSWLEECHVYHLETTAPALFGNPHLSTRILMGLDDLNQALITTSVHKNLFSEDYLQAVTELDRHFHRLFALVENYHLWEHLKNRYME